MNHSNSLSQKFKARFFVSRRIMRNALKYVMCWKLELPVKTALLAVNKFFFRNLSRIEICCILGAISEKRNIEKTSISMFSSNITSA